MYVRMYVCMYDVCMYVCMYDSGVLEKSGLTMSCVSMYVRAYVCMYV